MAFKLVYRSKGGREEKPLAGPRVTIGRDGTNQIVIADESRSISRFHARLDHDGRQWHIADTGSTNRTRLNGELLEPEAAQALADGDTILLGNLEVHFVREADEAIVFEEVPPDAQSITVKTAPRVKDLPSLIAALPSAPLTKEAAEPSRGLSRPSRC
jgi:pSer/pThr/pTyr-binding forkhead associated (FHA) protein